MLWRERRPGPQLAGRGKEVSRPAGYGATLASQRATYAAYFGPFSCTSTLLVEPHCGKDKRPGRRKHSYGVGEPTAPPARSHNTNFFRAQGARLREDHTSFSCISWGFIGPSSPTASVEGTRRSPCNAESCKLRPPGYSQDILALLCFVRTQCRSGSSRRMSLGWWMGIPRSISSMALNTEPAILSPSR